MIKGKYVATVTIEAEIQEGAPTLRPYEQLVEGWMGMEGAVTEYLEEEYGDHFRDLGVLSTVKVETQACHMEKTNMVHLDPFEEPHPIAEPVQTAVETHRNCTVQILRNTETGEQSIGWWPADQPPMNVKAEEG